METNCQCGALAEGFKCAQCGENFEAQPVEHECGDEMVQVKCSGCGEASDLCMCS